MLSVAQRSSAAVLCRQAARSTKRFAVTRVDLPARLSKASPYASNRVAYFGDTVWAEFTPLAIKHKAVNLSQGLPSIPVENFIMESLKSVAEPGWHHQYSRGAGHPRLVNAIAEHYSPVFKQQLDPLANICITTGATQGLFAFFHTFLNPGDEVIIMEPFYDSYVPQVLMNGGVPVVIPLRPAPPAPGAKASSADWKLDEAELRSAFSKRTKAILINTPHNPTGKVFSRSELQLIAELAIQHDVLVLSDEVYEMLTYDGVELVRPATLPGMWERTISLGSAGKAFNTTGWKIGWAIGPAPLIRSMQLTNQFIPFCVASPLQEALARAWEAARKNHFFQRQNDAFAAKREKTVAFLEENGLKPTIPQASYFVLADTSDVPVKSFGQEPARRDYDFCRWLTRDVGVAAIPPSCFYLEKDAHLAANYARFCFAKNDDDLANAKIRLKKIHAIARGEAQRDA